MLSSIGCGYNMNFTDIININIGASINQINSSDISDRTNIDTLKLYDTYGYPTYSDIANLSNYPDVDQSSDIPKSSFISLSTQLTINSHSIIEYPGKEKQIQKQQHILHLLIQLMDYFSIGIQVLLKTVFFIQLTV